MKSKVSKANTANKQPIMILASIILCVALSCNYLIPKDEERTTTSEGYYTIDRISIINSINQGESDIFALPIATPNNIAPIADRSVQWTASDYLLIAEAFHNFQWQESTDDWNLNHVDMTMKCEDILVGSQYVFFGILRTK